MLCRLNFSTLWVVNALIRLRGTSITYSSSAKRIFLPSNEWKKRDLPLKCVGAQTERNLFSDIVMVDHCL